MAMTLAQIAKLTPQERRQREKRLAYVRAYHKRRRARDKAAMNGSGLAHRRVSKGNLHVVVKMNGATPTDAKLNQLENWVTEVKEIRGRLRELLDHIRSVEI